MIAQQPTRTIVKELTRAGWTRSRTVGSHSMWKCPTGKHVVTVPDGHRMIAPGPVRIIRKAIAACDCEKKR